MCEYLNGLIYFDNTCGTQLSDYQNYQRCKSNPRKRFGEIQHYCLEQKKL